MRCTRTPSTKRRKNVIAIGTRVSASTAADAMCVVRSDAVKPFQPPTSLKLRRRLRVTPLLIGWDWSYSAADIGSLK